MIIEEDKAFDDKLNYIYESLKEITFDTETSSQPNHISAKTTDKVISNEESKSQSNVDFNYLFIKKLKIFSILKKNAKKRRENKKYYLKKDKMASMAKFFYWNLLKSRTFFGFAKLMKQKAYYSIIKNNHIDYRIGELAHNLIQILAYSCNRSKLISCAEQRHNKHLKKKVITYFKEKAHYKLSFYQYYISRILNNQYALSFMLAISSIAQNKMMYKSSFKAIYNKMQRTNELNYNKGLFSFAIKAFRINKEHNDNVLMRFKEIQLVIDYNCFIAKVNRSIKIKRLRINFMRKLFLMRYYVKFYQHQHDIKVIGGKQKQVIALIVKHDFLRLKHQIMTKASHKEKINHIMKHSNQIQSKDKLKRNITTNKTTISIEEMKTKQLLASVNQENSHNGNVLYYLKLKQQALSILKRHYLLQKKIYQFKESCTKKSLGLFFIMMKIKVIKDLIHQGIIEKIKKYQSVLLLQILFSSYFSKLKLTKCKPIRKKYLSKTALVLLRNNVTQNYKFIQLKMQYYIRIFTQKVQLIVAKRLRRIEHNKCLMQLMHYKVWFSLIKYKMQLAKQRRQSIDNLIVKNRNKSIKRFILCKRKVNSVLDNEDKKNRRVFARKLLNNVKRVIAIKRKQKNMKEYQRKKLLAVFNKNVHSNIINKTLSLIEYQFIIQKGYQHFRKGIKTKGKLIDNSYQLRLIAQKFYCELLLNSVIISTRLKTITQSVYQIYQNKIKEKVFQTYKKNYINKIKSSMLALRYREYLIAAAINKIQTKRSSHLSSTT